MRAVALIFFLAVLAGVAWLITRNGDLGGPAAPNGELGVAEEAGDALGDLESLVQEAMNNAERAEKIAKELTLAASRARQSAEELGGITVQNEAAELSAEASLLAAEDAEATALMMRRYADRMKGLIGDTLAVTENAEAIADMAIEVEETQAAAAEAAAEAREARARMAETEAVAGRLEGAGGDDAADRQARVPAAPSAEPLGDIVIINDAAATQRPAGQDQTDDPDEIRDRLETIFPDDVLDYEEEEKIPYGERG